uniref:Uncharacterized protein n=1 Tax=Aegilops tauschii TaxID=37682 RepID=N1QVH5_AEGTA
MARGSKKKNKAAKGSDPTAKLTDEILVDIISRMPCKYALRCKCVSRRWRDLFSQGDHRKKLPQTLAGFFHEADNPDRFPERVRCFTNASGGSYPRVSPSFYFLPNFTSLDLDILDCCNGLLLCRWWKGTKPKTVDYIVCNPATHKWVVVPGSIWSNKQGKVIAARLGFDPAVSSHFNVFVFVPKFVIHEDAPDDDDDLFNFQEAGFYSSETGVWIYRNAVWMGYRADVPINSRPVFLAGMLYMSAFGKRVIAVDLEGNNWRVIPTPVAPQRKGKPDDIYLSQGQLRYAHRGRSKLSIWVLEDYNSENWILKHKVSHSRLFGEEYSSFGVDYSLISIHPQHNMIFMICGWKKTLM